MDAKKCDRCHRYYDKYQGIKYEEHYYERVSMNNITGHQTSYDLCPACMKEFISWLLVDRKETEVSE